jgi:RNA polymerase-binding transcription factor DksA
MTPLSESSMERHRLEVLHEVAAACKQSDPERAALAAEAIRRINEGEYGFCTACGLQIPELELQRSPERQDCPRCNHAA